VNDDPRLLAALARLTPRKWLAYILRAAWLPAVAYAWHRTVGASRSAAWHLSRTLLRLTYVVLTIVAALRPPPTDKPDEDAPTPPTPGPTVATTTTASGVRIRDKRKVPRIPVNEATAPEPAAAPTRGQSWRLAGWPWWGLIGALLRYADRRSVPHGLGPVATGRAACSHRLQAAVVGDLPHAPVDIAALLALADDEIEGDWRLPVTYWMRDHVSASSRAELVASELVAPDSLARGRLSVLLRVAAATVAALPDASARTLLGTALSLSRRNIDPYADGGPVVGGRHLAVRLLVERPELDAVVHDSLALQAPCSGNAVIPVELRLLALALRERAPDAGAALIAAAVKGGVSAEQLRSVARLSDQPLPRPPSVRTTVRARAPFARLLRAIFYVLPWLWPLAVMVAVGLAAHRQSWTAAPKEFGLAEAVAALALLATVNVFTVQLSAQRLGGVVARYAAQPASLQASYSAALAAVLLAVVPPIWDPFDDVRSWVGLTALGVFVLTFLFALLRFQRQSDAARAAAAHVRAISPGARAAGRRLGRLQARAVDLRDALDAVPMVTTSIDEVHGEWRSLIVAPSRGLLVPRRHDLRALLSRQAFTDGLRLRLFVGLGNLVRVGEHLGALVPPVDQGVDRWTRWRTRRRLRVVRSDDVEDVQRSAIALVQLALQLAEAGDVGTAERVCRSVVELVTAHTAAARGARIAAFRRHAVRAGAAETGPRGEWLTAQAARRSADDQLVPVVPALGSMVRLVAQAQVGPEQHRFEVSTNLLIPLLDAAVEADGTLQIFSFAAGSSSDGIRTMGRTELLRLVGVRAVELRAETAFTGVLDQLDRLVEDGEREGAAHTTSVLAATTARSDPRLASVAVRKFVEQAGPGADTALMRRRGLWRVGAAALAAGTSSVAVDVALLLASLGDAVAVRADTRELNVLQYEALQSSLYGGYLGERDLDALANYGTFLDTVEPLLPAPAPS
jgi:hypothetical protein